MKKRLLFIFGFIVLVFGLGAWYNRRNRAYEAALWESATDQLD